MGSRATLKRRRQRQRLRAKLAAKEAERLRWASLTPLEQLREAQAQKAARAKDPVLVMEDLLRSFYQAHLDTLFQSSALMTYLRRR